MWRITSRGGRHTDDVRESENYEKNNSAFPKRVLRV